MTSGIGYVLHLVHYPMATPTSSGSTLFVNSINFFFGSVLYQNFVFFRPVQNVAITYLSQCLEFS